MIRTPPAKTGPPSGTGEPAEIGTALEEFIRLKRIEPFTRRWPDKTRRWEAWYVPGGIGRIPDGSETDMIRLTRLFRLTRHQSQGLHARHTHPADLAEPSPGGLGPGGAVSRWYQPTAQTLHEPRPRG